MTAFPLVDVALEGVRLTRERPGTVLAWGVVLAAAQAVTVALLVLSGSGEGLAAFTRLGAVPGADPAAAAALLSGAAPGMLLSVAAGLLAQAAVYAALLRAVLRPADKRFAFLRVGLDELRLLGVLAALTALGVVTLLVLVTALGMLILPLASVGGYALSGAMPLVMALAVAALSYPAVRLSLAPAASVAEGRTRLFGVWPLTRGVFWPLMASVLLAAVLATVIAILGEVLVTALWAMGAGVTMEQAAAALQPDLRSAAGVLTPGAIGGVVTGGVISAFALTAAAAPGAAAYRVLARRPA